MFDISRLTCECDKYLSRTMEAAMNDPLLLRKHREYAPAMFELRQAELEHVGGGHCPDAFSCGTTHTTPNDDGCSHGGDSD